MLNESQINLIDDAASICKAHLNSNNFDFFNKDDTTQSLILYDQAFLLMYHYFKKENPDWLNITEDDRRHIGVVAGVCANHFKEMDKLYSDNLDLMPDIDKSMYNFDVAYLLLYKWSLEKNLPNFGIIDNYKNKMN